MWPCPWTIASCLKIHRTELFTIGFIFVWLPLHLCFKQLKIHYQILSILSLEMYDKAQIFLRNYQYNITLMKNLLVQCWLVSIISKHNFNHSKLTKRQPTRCGSHSFLAKCYQYPVALPNKNQLFGRLPFRIWKFKFDTLCVAYVGNNK